MSVRVRDRDRDRIGVRVRVSLAYEVWKQGHDPRNWKKWLLGLDLGSGLGLG